jgi:hypothetical protein
MRRVWTANIWLGRSRWNACPHGARGGERRSADLTPARTVRYRRRQAPIIAQYTRINADFRPLIPENRLYFVPDAPHELWRGVELWMFSWVDFLKNLIRGQNLSGQNSLRQSITPYPSEFAVLMRSRSIVIRVGSTPVILKKWRITASVIPSS